MKIFDEKNREIFEIKAGKIIIFRYNDLSDEYKDFIATLYSEMTGENPSKSKDFLNFRSEENQFCP